MGRPCKYHLKGEITYPANTSSLYSPEPNVGGGGPHRQPRALGGDRRCRRHRAASHHLQTKKAARWILALPLLLALLTCVSNAFAADNQARNMFFGVGGAMVAIFLVVLFDYVVPRCGWHGISLGRTLIASSRSLRSVSIWRRYHAKVKSGTSPSHLLRWRTTFCACWRSKCSSR